MKKCITLYIDEEIDREFQNKLCELQMITGKRWYRSRIIQDIMTMFAQTDFGLSEEKESDQQPLKPKDDNDGII